MKRAKNGSIQSIANSITPYRRRVLYELSRMSRPATTEHVHSELHVSSFLIVKGPARHPRWPGSALHWLHVFGYIDRQTVMVGDWHFEFWSIKPLGKSVARWCYLDGEVATS